MVAMAVAPALYRCRRQADALAAYRVVRETVVAQLGVEPGRVLQALNRAASGRTSSRSERSSTTTA
jgi:DNA-binding SARP family transcriptional activator